MASACAIDLEPLRERIRLVHQGGAGDVREHSVLDFGVSEVERLLPWQGLGRGLHELVGDGTACLGLVVVLLGRHPADHPVLWCRAGYDTGLPHGPGLAALGLPANRLVLLQARRKADALWAMEEGLRCGRLAAVIGDGIVPTPIAARRLQLAAETGGTPAFLLLSPTAQPPPSTALTRWRITTAPSRPKAQRLGMRSIGRPCWRVALTRCRGGGLGEWVLEWDDEALRLDLVAELGNRPLAAAE